MYCDHMWQVKLKLDMTDPEGERKLQAMYLEYAKGLNWVFRYYYRGCVSWDWYIYIYIYIYMHPWKRPS